MEKNVKKTIVDFINSIDFKENNPKSKSNKTNKEFKLELEGIFLIVLDVATSIILILLGILSIVSFFIMQLIENLYPLKEWFNIEAILPLLTITSFPLLVFVFVFSLITIFYFSKNLIVFRNKLNKLNCVISNLNNNKLKLLNLDLKPDPKFKSIIENVSLFINK